MSRAILVEGRRTLYKVEERHVPVSDPQVIVRLRPRNQTGLQRLRGQNPTANTMNDLSRMGSQYFSPQKAKESKGGHETIRVKSNAKIPTSR